MEDNLEKYGLDLHCTMMLEEYREKVPVLEKMAEIVIAELKRCLTDNNIVVTAVEFRIKTEKSLAGKLELKGNKYRTTDDITDLLGARVITYYTDEVDKIAVLVAGLFEIDWDNSVDKRSLLGLNTFGYQSLHYICRIPKKMYFDPKMPQINEIRFELQMRTTLQHAWSNVYHDNGYKTDVAIPDEYIRRIMRLSGLLELADDECSRIRREIGEYRRKVEALVKNGDFDKVRLDQNTFRSYLATGPYDKLNEKIASINQAEIQKVSEVYFLEPLVKLGFKTLGDLERMKNECFNVAYSLGAQEIGRTDLDIISSSLALQNLCFAYIVMHGYGVKGLEDFLEDLNGHSEYNKISAERTYANLMELQYFNSTH